MKKQEGITLVALVITIIVMLILVAVTITIAINGGLFTTAKDAANATNDAIQAETNLSNGQVNIDGSIYDINDYATNSDPTAINDATL